MRHKYSKILVYITTILAVALSILFGYMNGLFG